MSGRPSIGDDATAHAVLAAALRNCRRRWQLLALCAWLLVLIVPALASASKYHHAASESSRVGAFTAGVGAIRKPALGVGPRVRHWVCPQGACEAILAPEPLRVGAGWELPDSHRLLEGGGEFGGYDPKDLQSAYRIPTTLSAPQTVAVVDAFGYPDAESDLISYRKRYGLPVCTKADGCFEKVNESGEEGKYPPASAEWQEESALDVDMVSAACPECHIMLVEATNSDDEVLAEADNTAARLGATEISNSYGAPETEPECEGDGCSALDKDYEHPGVLITASAGDSGYDEIYAGLGSPEFPASVPDVVAVGGTALHKDAGVARGWREEVWNEPEYEPDEGIGSGSGCTTFQPKPSWQKDTGCAGRTENDVAAVAAVETGVSVRIDGEWGIYGGTSVASPLIAAIEAHASAAVRALGPDAFYEDPGALFDVTEGFNYSPGEDPCLPHAYLCNAEVGYDGPSGLGTPDGVPTPGEERAPVVSVSAASELRTASAELHGTVDPNGLVLSECKFEYGTTTTYGSSAVCSPSPGSGTSAVAVSAALSGLKGGTTYYFRISAANSAGSVQSSKETFITAAAPEVAVDAPSELKATSARLNATVNPKGLLVSECRFQYGTTTGYGSSVACSPSPGSGTSAVAVSGALPTLKAGTTYDFRLVAKNPAGTTTTANYKVTTLAPPTATSKAASALTASSATLNGSVNPKGSAVSECVFEYGTSTKYGSSVACSPSPGSGTVAVAVSAPVSSLKADTTYDFRIFATNAGGSAKSSNETFRTTG